MNGCYAAGQVIKHHLTSASIAVKTLEYTITQVTSTWLLPEMNARAHMQFFVIQNIIIVIFASGEVIKHELSSASMAKKTLKYTTTHKSHAC